ncbi:MAG TPA: alkaline phosphatase family protein, partial [Gemmatimonadales bacterium]|nr:alkaline phosphatase family protein [Gemmatimonadales bacterium]
MHRPARHATQLAGILAALVFVACQREQPVAPLGPSLQADRDGREQRHARVPDRLQHLVVIYLENHSFDNLYGEFPGADGLSNAAATETQVDATGTPFATLPQVSGAAFPANLPNAPFSIEAYVPANQKIRDLVHRFYQEQMQIDGGRMDKFALVSDAKGEVMGFYHTAPLPLAAEAANYTLCDNFFHAAFGGSFLNHIWLVAARTPVFPNAPASITAVLGTDGSLVSDGAVTPDGYAVNTIFTVNQPHPATTPAANLLPNQTFATIGDRLSERHISWAWYSGGWNDALAGHAAPLFQFHHQPFAYFANYADGTAAKAEHLRDESEFIAAAQAGRLRAVSFIKPLGPDNEHPGYADLTTGENHVLELINAVRNGPDWPTTAIVITYDEHGGFWDHVAPPVVDRWGPGSRVPALVIAPFAKRHFIDH